MELLIVTLLIGLLLVSAELFVPGGILGIIGAISLIASVVTAFGEFGPSIGTYYLIGVLLLTTIAISLTVRVAPRSKMTRSLFLREDERGYRSQGRDLSHLKGKTGLTLTALRPAGMARIEKKRIDVVTEGSLVEKGTPVRVIEVEGNRVVVRAVEDNSITTP